MLVIYQESLHDAQSTKYKINIHVTLVIIDSGDYEDCCVF